MVNFRNNNNRRNNFRRSERSFKTNGERGRYNTNFSSNENFQRKIPSRNNHNASKLIDKYNNLAREALSSGDKILSENYFQHADHFTRILSEQERFKKSNYTISPEENKSLPLSPDEKGEKNLKKEEEKLEKIASDVN